MNKKLAAEIISSLFHPVSFFIIMPFVIVYKSTLSSMVAIRWEIFSIAFIFVAISFMIYGRIKGFFSDFDLTIRRERYKFYTTLLLFGLIYIAIALYFRGIFFPISLISLGIAFGIGVFDFFNRFIKASDHMAVATAFVLTIGLLYGGLGLIFVSWIIPVTAWSRIILKRHTLSEVIAGSILGALVTLSTFFVGKALY